METREHWEIGALFVIQTKGDDSVGLIKKRRKKKEVALWMKSMDMEERWFIEEYYGKGRIDKYFIP